MAATPFDTAMNSVQTTVTGYITAAFPVIAAVVGASLGIRWFKKLANKV